MVLMKKIKAIEFGIISPEEARKMSAIEIKNPDTYDKDGYPMELGLMDPHLGVINPGLRCKTCGQKMKQCPGHFGTIELVRPVVHSEFGKKIEELMNASCEHCGRFALKDDKLDELRAMLGVPTEILVKKILLKTKKVKKCPHCAEMRRLILLDKPTNFFSDKERIYPSQIREWMEKIPDRDLVLFGYNTKRIRPEWFILTAVLVPPITMRPSITLDTGIKSEDDLTHKLVDIIRINSRLKDNIDAGAPQLIIEDLWDLLQYHVTTFYNNNTAGVPPAKHRSGRALKTLVQRLKGKKGRFRYNLTGKRVNFAARSTITPDPFISINELGVPEMIANDMTVPEIVAEWNVKNIKKMLKDTDNIEYVVRPNGMRKIVNETNKKEIMEELDVGFKIERKLMNGDIVLFNRQPSLHRLSMMAHKVRVMPGKTFRINPIVCNPYNADFDGDEMNMHVPQTEEGKTEAKELMFVQNQILSPRHSGPVIVSAEDGVSGSFVLTMDSTVFSREEAMQSFYEIGLTEIPKPDKGKNYSGKLIFSQMLPKDLNLEYPTVLFKLLRTSGKIKDIHDKDMHPDALLKIKNGQLITGVIDDESLGDVSGKLVEALTRNYEPEVLEQFYYKLNRIVYLLITKKGMTVGLDEFAMTKGLEEVRTKAIKMELEEAEKLVELFKKGHLETIPGRTYQESFELKMMELGARVKSSVQKAIIGEKLDKLLSDNPPMDAATIIFSGSRGSPLNLTNIQGMWGQAAVREGRPRRGYKNRLITLNQEKDVGAIAGGFVKTNFLEGMAPREFFYHAMGGRQGEVDTSVATKVSGYLYRRLANSLKDLVVSYDQTTRTASKNIIQFSYGEDSVFPANAVKGKTLDVKTEIERATLTSANKKIDK
ncbi:MAG: DNA-directed RNA polymerase subunit A' [archaeon]|nr:DNA-directed RNA polymerase subunit A' [archaeon]